VSDRLVLPFLNYSDAGRYSVTIQSGTNEISLPGAVVAIADPCQGLPTGKVASASPLYRIVGSTPEPILLEASDVLEQGLPWKVLGTIPSSVEPILWDVSTGPTRFYRFSRTPP
jgi:hypothetical protein